jgi:hypothetical protein
MTISMHNGLSTFFSRYLLGLGSVGVNSDDGIPNVKSTNVSIYGAAIPDFIVISLLLLFRIDKPSLLPSCSARALVTGIVLVVTSSFLCLHSTHKEE